VIPTDFDWKRFIGKRQIGTVVNFVATSVWVLALFPKAFQRTWLYARARTGRSTRSIVKMKASAPGL
jgi:hypothetical protein